MAAVMAATAAGVTFPTLEGRNLAGEDVTVPGSFPGQTLLVCMGFIRDSQEEVEPWAQVGMAAFGKDARFKVLEMPMYSGAARLFRPFIDRGMAGATPKELHGNVITSTSVDAAMDGLKLLTKDRAAIALVAPDGSVRFLGRGAPTGESVLQFHAALDALKAELPPAK